MVIVVFSLKKKRGFLGYSMCIIVDTNLASRIFSRQDDNFSPILNWVEGRKGMLVHGGRLSRELFRLREVRRILIEYDRQGFIHRSDDNSVDEEEGQVSGDCNSDDPHIIALARVSGARVLCTNDRDLMDDFCNRNLVPNPRGHIYQRREHAHLLNCTPGCPGYRRRN